MHGGRGNSAPKSEAGRRRVIAAHIKSGRYTKDAKHDQSRGSARLARLEDAMHVLGMTTASRTRGRKADSYVPVTCIQDVAAMALDGELHIDGASLEG